MPRLILATLAALTLAACNGKPLTMEGLPITAIRAYADTFQDHPFDEGPVSIIAEEHGELHTYKLRACHGGEKVCGTRAVPLLRAPDYFVAENAYPGRTFYLSPGGDGWMKVGGRLIGIAWHE